MLVESAKYALKYCMGLGSLVRGNVWGVSMDQKVLKDTPPVLHLFFSSACRILLDLWTFYPVGHARALSEDLHVCARARAYPWLPISKS